MGVDTVRAGFVLMSWLITVFISPTDRMEGEWVGRRVSGWAGRRMSGWESEWNEWLVLGGACFYILYFRHNGPFIH